LLEGDVEQNLSDYWIAPSATKFVDEPTNLLVAWPAQPELFRDRGDTSVGLRDWTVLVVEPRNRRYETSAQAG
jgi:hypothetical protein